MKSLIVALALVACSTLAVAMKEAHLHDLRQRLGHFGVDGPYLDLYKFYAAAFVKPLHPNRPNDDYRNYMPSADECLVYLRQFRMQKFIVHEFEEMAILDGCLGYLFGRHDDPSFDKDATDSQRADMDMLRGDTQLKDLYMGTKVNQYTIDAQTCLADLLGSSIVAKVQFKDEVCSHEHLQLYIQYAECQDNYPELYESRGEDKYLEIIYDLLRRRVRKCFFAEINSINNISRRTWKKNKMYRAMLKTRHMVTSAANLVRTNKNTLAAQKDERMYPDFVATLLTAVQDTKDQINLRHIHQVLRGVYLNDQVLVSQFLGNIAKFVNKVQTERPQTMERTANDVYRRLVDKVCRKFRSSSDPKDIDLATPFIRMVRLLHHEKLFGISEQEFVHNCLTEAYESAALYMGVSSCNLLTYTEAALVQEDGAVSSYNFKVDFVPDTSSMIKWPTASYY